jgi:hypothetical protein
VEGRTLVLGVVLTGIVVIAIGLGVLFGGGPPAVPPRPKPPIPGTASSATKYSATLYRAALEQDSRIYGLPVVRPEDMANPFSYFNEWSGDRRLKVGSSMQTPHLRLSLVVRKEAGTMEGQTYRADHLVLRIDNLTSHHLAYRIGTSVSDEARCQAKGDAPHNAIAIEPGQTIYRTECLYRADQRIDVRSVEVMELPRLSAAYVSRLRPALVLYSPRASAGHMPPRGELCPQMYSWREIRDGADRNELGWRDVIDFYARHNCDEYSFFLGYHYRTDPAAPLPARPPE